MEAFFKVTSSKSQNCPAGLGQGSAGLELPAKANVRKSRGV